MKEYLSKGKLMAQEDTYPQMGYAMKEFSKMELCKAKVNK